MNVAIRLAGAEDAAALSVLAAATFGLACPPHTTQEAKAAFIADVLSEERFSGYLADPKRELLVAETAEGPAIGYTMLVFDEPHDADVAAALRIRPTVELSKCYVLADHHGAGTAGLLMAESLARIARRDVGGVWLGVNQENERAQRFYAKHGFERVGTKRFLVGDRLEDDYVMERVLG